jgi:hypothetical protein
MSREGDVSARVLEAEDQLERLRARGEVVHWEPAGHGVRPGAWIEQAEATPDRIEAALQEGRFDDAAALGRHLITEAQEIHDLYTEWSAAVPEILLRDGVPPDIVTGARERLSEETGARDPERDWRRFLDSVEAFAVGCASGWPGHGERLEKALDAWRTAHDRHRDLVAAWVQVAVEQLGERQLGALWQELEADAIEAYDRYDLRRAPWERSFPIVVQTAIEGMHGHLGGPRGRGEVEVTDHGDRLELSFAPCGSGGRIRAAERFGVTRERHDWAWNETGVCHYCVHCCVLMQLEPIDRLGYSIRVIDPPLEPGEPCSWTIYRDPADVPESAYRRVGRTKRR